LNITTLYIKGAGEADREFLRVESPSPPFQGTVVRYGRRQILASLLLHQDESEGVEREVGKKEGTLKGSLSIINSLFSFTSPGRGGYFLRGRSGLKEDREMLDLFLARDFHSNLETAPGPGVPSVMFTLPQRRNRQRVEEMGLEVRNPC